MNTRILETKNVIRNTVDRVEFIKKESNSFFFKAPVISELFHSTIFRSEDLTKEIRNIEVHNKLQAILCIEIVSDKILRVRYNEGNSLKLNKTQMLEGSFTGPKRLELQRSAKDYLDNHMPIGVERFDLDSHEAIYGFGEKFSRLNKVGQTIDLLMSGTWGVTTPRSYKNVPFFVSTKGYGVFLNHSSPITCWVGSMSSVDIQIAVEDDFLDYFVIAGDIKEVLSQYTDITGKGVLPPKWTFGFWQSKASYKSAKETLRIAKKLREYEIPCDVINIDTHWYKKEWFCDLEFDKDRFPNPKKYFEDMKELGIKIALWQLPYIPEGSQYFEELKAVDGFVKNQEGEIYDIKICLAEGFKGIVGCIDFTNPNAVDVYKKWIRRLFILGAKIIKTDFGEDAPIDGIYYDNTPGHQMRNLFPLLYNRAVAEVTKEMIGSVCAWSRSAWAGNQRYPVHWGGDASTDWTNMIPQLEGGLSLGLSGFQFWSQDIGGFLGFPKDKLLIRWMQIGLFNSHSRIHGMGRREIYKFSSETVRICKKYIQQRYKLLPYIYGSAIKCVKKSLPMSRALVIEYQNDPTVWNIGNEFMFGDSLLVAPITNDTNKREIYLPEGMWTDWWTNERIQGKQWINVHADIDTLPLYIREGGIIPIAPVMNYIDEFEIKEIKLKISLYKRDGKSNFTVPVNDEQVLVEYTAVNSRHELKISKTSVLFKIDALREDESEINIIRG
jgi:alpha-D-xyloside xylohydrolase